MTWTLFRCSWTPCSERVREHCSWTLLNGLFVNSLFNPASAAILISRHVHVRLIDTVFSVFVWKLSDLSIFILFASPPGPKVKRQISWPFPSHLTRTLTKSLKFWILTGFLTESHQNLVRFSSDSRQILVRISSESHQNLVRISSGSCQDLVRFSSGSCQILVRFSSESCQNLVRISSSHQNLVRFWSDSRQILVRISSESRQNLLRI